MGIYFSGISLMKSIRATRGKKEKEKKKKQQQQTPNENKETIISIKYPIYIFEEVN